MSQGFPSAALEGAPIGMIVNHQEQLTLLVSQSVIAAIITIVVLKRSSRDTLGVNLMLLVAGGLSFMLEPLADAMLLIWHPVIGQWTAIRAFGHFVPVWVPAVFYWAFGGQALWMLVRLRQGATRSQLWKLYAIFAATDFIFEAPPLWTGSYVYYGDQPLVWPPYMPLPLFLPFGNAVVPIGAAVVAYLAERHLEARRRPWLIVPLALTAMFSALTWYAWPVALALNSPAATTPVRWLSGLVSIGISLLVVWLVVRTLGVAAPSYGTQRADTPAPHAPIDRVPV